MQSSEVKESRPEGGHRAAELRARQISRAQWTPRTAVDRGEEGPLPYRIVGSPHQAELCPPLLPSSHRLLSPHFPSLSARRRECPPLPDHGLDAPFSSSADAAISYPRPSVVPRTASTGHC